MTNNGLGNYYYESDGVSFTKFCRPFFCHKESLEANKRAYLYDNNDAFECVSECPNDTNNVKVEAYKCVSKCGSGFVKYYTNSR